MSEEKNLNKEHTDNKSSDSETKQKREYIKPSIESAGKLKELRMQSGGTGAPTHAPCPV